MDAINEEVDDGNAEAISFEIVNIYHFLPLPTIVEEKEEEYFESIRNLPLQTILEEEEQVEEDEGETSGGCSISEAETSVSAGPTSVPGLSEAFADETQADKKKPAEATATTANDMDNMEEERTGRQKVIASLLVILFVTVVIYSFMKCTKTKKTN